MIIKLLFFIIRFLHTGTPIIFIKLHHHIYICIYIVLNRDRTQVIEKSINNKETYNIYNILIYRYIDTYTVLINIISCGNWNNIILYIYYIHLYIYITKKSIKFVKHATKGRTKR